MKHIRGSMENELYDVNKYTESQLFEILDMNQPTDRELEAKIIGLMRKYESNNQMHKFFSDIYKRFFDTDDEDYQEGMTSGIGIVVDSSANTSSFNVPTDKAIGYQPQSISSVQQFDYAPDKLQLNPLIKQTIKRVISIDSQYRNISTSPLTTSFSFDLSEPLRDVVSLKLYSIQIPYTWYTISKSYGSNFFYLKGNSPGLYDDKYSYKISIPPGNYDQTSLPNAINSAFQDLSNSIASDVNFNGVQLVSYNKSTARTTIALNIQNTFNETYYSLYFPQWTSPDISSSRVTTIAGYLGFNQQTYYSNAIGSNQTKYTTQTINSQINQDYLLDNTNNYFTVVQYLGYDEFAKYDSRSTVLTSIKVQMMSNGLNYTGPATRSNIIAAINTALSTSPYFDTTSSIQQIDITNSSLGPVQNAGNSYFRLTIVLNRSTVKYVPNAKIIVLFPNEIAKPNQNNESFTIWQWQSGLYASAFFFDTSMNEFSQFISETPSVQSTFTIDSSANMFLRCNTHTYDVSINNFSMNVPAGVYTMTQYLNTITNTFSTQNTLLGVNYFNMTNTVALLDPANKFNLQIDLTKAFTNKNYSVAFDNTSLLSTTKSTTYGYGPGFGDSFSSNINDLSYGTPYGTIGGTFATIYTGYAVDTSYVLTIYPSTKYGNDGNGAAAPIPVCLPNGNDISPTNLLYFNSYALFMTAIQSAITNTIVSNPTINETQTPLSRSIVSYNMNTSGALDISLNMNCYYFLSEANYDISFTDGILPISNPSNAWNIFDISDSYNLYDTKLTNPYATIIGSQSILANSINILQGYNTIVFSTNSATAPSDTITISIPPRSYTIGTLYTAINSALSALPKTYGSHMEPYILNDEVYTKISLNINRVYTTSDYILTFYDPVSFITCFSGSSSIQNTTWDTTVGWILGFRDYTQYYLTQENQTQNTTFPDQKYYLQSLNGSYYYTPTISSNGKLLTNVAISITADTALNVNLYNYFLISLDDFIQNHLNDGLVTITRSQTSIQIPEYSYATTQTCDPATNTKVSKSLPQTNSDNVTNAQLYAMNQSVSSQANMMKPYSAGPFIKDLFGIIPLKPPANTGDYYTDFGGTLQNQERLYFGPVNIRKMSIQLLTDRGNLVDLNGSNWSFSFVCEQLYRATST
jgi:hypothetical protein